MKAETVLAGKRVAALIPAAGSGQRMGGVIAKPFLHLGGREILARTLEVFEACAAIDEVWVIVAAAQQQRCQQEIVTRYGLRKVRGVIVGGVTRQESVWHGLQQVTEGIDLVVVHDGVRPFVTASVLAETLHAAGQYGAAVAAVPVKDTLKRVSSDSAIEATISREGVWRVQTPQAFQRQLLCTAFHHALQQGITVTDEAGLIEALGHQVRIVPGRESNIKITTPDDLHLGAAFLDTVP
jgi:2-C-methyl-D-erythritol 4-phosphate cytidylyltransferase